MNENETILIPLLSLCYGYSTIFSLNSQPTILQVKKREHQYDIISFNSFDSEIHFSYINSIEHLSNDILLLFNHFIIKSNKYNSYLLTFTLKDPNYSFCSYLQSTKINITIVAKDSKKREEKLHFKITLIPKQMNADLFKLIMYYSVCLKCSGNFSRSKSFEIQTIKNSNMYYSIIANAINKTITKIPNGSLTDYIINSNSDYNDDDLISLFNLENLSMLYDQLTLSYHQIIRLQWHDVQNYKHKYINSL